MQHSEQKRESGANEWKLRSVSSSMLNLHRDANCKQFTTLDHALALHAHRDTLMPIVSACSSHGDAAMRTNGRSLRQITRQFYMHAFCCCCQSMLLAWCIVLENIMQFEFLTVGRIFFENSVILKKNFFENFLIRKLRQI